MKITSLQMHNFRRYEDAHFKFHPGFSVLIGENGFGKTTILDALSILLGTYFQGWGIISGQGVVRKDDARIRVEETNKQLYFHSERDVFIQANAVFADREIRWRRDMGDRGGKARDFIQYASESLQNAEKELSVRLPLFLYYGSGRLWETHRDKDNKKPKSRLEAYRFCLDPKSDQKAFERWFRQLTQSSMQKKEHIPAIDAVRSAVLSCIPDAQDFYFDIQRDEILVKLKIDGWISFNNLSDGYRNMIAMVADIAYRAARLNPGDGDRAGKLVEGVVLIDELDLHLHPRWQRTVVESLSTGFPNMQFIASTHSPFIIQSLKEGQVIDLQSTALVTTEDVHDTASPGPNSEFSDSSIEDIVENIMRISLPQRSERLKKMYEAAKAYYAVLEQSKKASGDEIQKLKDKLDELSAPYSEEVAYHAFLEMKRIAAGMGES